MAASSTLRGTVARIVHEKGFGFIQSADGGDDVFFHRSSLAPGDFDRLRVGALVAYTVTDSSKGPRAASVTLDEPD